MKKKQNKFKNKMINCGFVIFSSSSVKDQLYSAIYARYWNELNELSSKGVKLNKDEAFSLFSSCERAVIRDYNSSGRTYMKYFNSNKWHFRNNKKRKKANTNNGKHPSLVVGESDNGNHLLNIGLTSSKKRGHHKNIEISNPQNWNKNSYLRDDIQLTNKDDLKQILFDYKLNPRDVNKILKMIDKYKKKNSH